ncbi:hypothetical protein G7685_002440 [Escherichia coli]|nr:hypothetical protein [Escherichia coli]
MDLSDGGRSPRHGAVVRGQTQKFLTPAAKSFVAGTSLPWTTETGCGRVCPPESPSAENGPQCGGRQAQWPYTPSGVQGAPHPARLKKNDGTTMACGGH